MTMLCARSVGTWSFGMGHRDWLGIELSCCCPLQQPCIVQGITQLYGKELKDYWKKKKEEAHCLSVLQQCCSRGILAAAQSPGDGFVLQSGFQLGCAGGLCAISGAVPSYPTAPAALQPPGPLPIPTLIHDQQLHVRLPLLKLSICHGKRFLAPVPCRQELWGQSQSAGVIHIQPGGALHKRNVPVHKTDEGFITQGAARCCLGSSGVSGAASPPQSKTRQGAWLQGRAGGVKQLGSLLGKIS